MSRPRFLSSSVGSKLLIGLTGLFLVIYLIVHITGNLMVFGGRDFFNRYAGALASNPLIPLIEIVLLAGFLTHIYKTITMFAGNQAARPVKYLQKKSAGHTSRKTFASSTMIVTGIWLVVFLVVHVKAFKFGAHYETADGTHDLYRVEMEALSNPLTLVFYVLSMLVVGSHLFHGVASGFQSLGFDHPRWTPRILILGKLLALVIAGGFIAIALWAHFIANPQGAA